jgi:hypothetical protein
MPYDPNDPGADARRKNKKAEENVKTFFDGVRQSNEANERHRKAEEERQRPKTGGSCLVTLAILTLVAWIVIGLLY